MLILKHYKLQMSGDLMSLAAKLALDAVMWDIVAGFG
jgi:hypothetical protein